MATQYPSDRPGANRGARPASSRPTSSGSVRRTNGTGRPASSGARPQQRTGARTGSTGRPASRSNVRRRKKAQGRFYAILAVAAVLIIALAVVLLTRPRGDGNKPAPQAVTANTPVENVQDNAPAAPATGDHGSALQDLLGDADQHVEGLSSDQLAKVTDLSINPNLPSEWLNVLLLGSDERTLSESARTDSMIICSINTVTGQVKLTSIMRDLAVNLTGIGDYERYNPYRINAANYFGGERLAIKTVNECFNLNIEHYVHVNFFGFQQVAQMLGGIDIDISEEEMEAINGLSVEQGMFSFYAGFDESNIPYELLDSYGQNTHLDGRQTLAYARIRKMDGGDFARAERQRTVLNALLNKVRTLGLGELMNIGMQCLQYFRTDLDMNTILQFAQIVVNSDLGNIESMRLPVNNTYKQESRNNQSMFYDCDWNANATQLYNFIYG